MSEHRCPTPGKIAYASADAARKARGNRRNKGGRMRPYLCRCGHWHLTTSAIVEQVA